MKASFLFRDCLRMTVRYPLRSFLMGIGIVIGVAALVVTRSYGAGAEDKLMKKINRMFNSSSLYLGAGGGMNRNQMAQTLTLEDLQALAAQIDEIEIWDPLLIAGGREVRYQGKSLTLNVYGHSERAAQAWGRDVSRGTFFSSGDVSATARVALLGSKTAKQLFGAEDPVGQTIQIAGSPFRVKGILEDQGTDPHGMDRDKDVHIPISTMMRRVKNVAYLTGAKLIIREADQVPAVEQAVHQLMRQRHQIAEGQAKDFFIISPKLVKQMVDGAGRVFKLYLPMAAAFALLLASLVIANIMLISVRERTPEIGVRKAVGASKQQIAFQFLLESTVLCGLSGMVGLVLGTAVMLVFANSMGIEAVLDPWALLSGMLAAVLVGVLAGALPARFAANRDAVACLQ